MNISKTMFGIYKTMLNTIVNHIKELNKNTDTKSFGVGISFRAIEYHLDSINIYKDIFDDDLLTEDVSGIMVTNNYKILLSFISKDMTQLLVNLLELSIVLNKNNLDNKIDMSKIKTAIEYSAEELYNILDQYNYHLAAESIEDTLLTPNAFLTTVLEISIKDKLTKIPKNIK